MPVGFTGQYFSVLQYEQYIQYDKIDVDIFILFLFYSISQVSAEFDGSSDVGAGSEVFHNM